MKYILRYFTLILIPIIMIFISPTTIKSSTHYFEDFEDGYADGWTVTLLQDCMGSNWKVENGMYGFEVISNDRNNGCKTNSILTGIQIPEDANYSYEFDMKFSGSTVMDRNFLVKYADSGKWYGFHIVNTTMWFEKVLQNQTYPNPFPINYYNFDANFIHHFKIDVNDNTVDLDIDYGKFTYTYTDIDPILPNKYVGLRASTGYILASKVWFDNISLEIYPKNNKFNLPFPYTNREEPSHEEFAYNFWKRMTASFDHNKLGNRFQPFTAESYIKKDCPNGVYGITCYDSHNGTDFSANKSYGNYDVLPVADGEVVYVSDTSESGKCMTSKNSYGCVVIIKHLTNNLYSLYAHLSEIYTKAGDNVKYTDIIGKMGNSGCGPKCGVHLHLGVLIDKTPNPEVNFMTKSDWEEMLLQSEPAQSVQYDAPPKHYCTYKTSDGNILSFQDPSGWSSDIITDRWAQPNNEGGCGTESPYLWMRNIGTTKPQVDLSKYILQL